jgi:EPS-associated MarR family transcriptional regulator
MNDLYEHEIRYKLLKILADEPHLSQRELSRRMGISLGKTNYVLAELAEKGVITIKRLANAPQGIPYMYTLTPQGLEHKARITARFLKRKLAEYECIKAQIQEIASDLPSDAIGDAIAPDTLEALAKVR